MLKNYGLTSVAKIHNIFHIFAFSKTHPSSLTLKGGSTSHPSPLSSEERDVTAPTRRSEPLRSKVGGASEPSPGCAGWDRLGDGLGDGIVVMDSKQDYYLVDSNLKKTYIGCNNPKNEKEDLNVVMPRLGKKFYHEMMLQKKEMNRFLTIGAL